MTDLLRRAKCAGRVVLLFVALVNEAAAQQSDTPQQLVGLFVQSCLAFAGDPGGLRDWARHEGLSEVADPARRAFLLGAPGTAFDASAPGSKLVVVSSDDGICSVVTNQANGGDVITALEAGLARAEIKWRLVIERDDKQISALHDREYLATKQGRSWRILAATVTDQQGGQAMLTGAPE
jgi:hypothetical protein